jgi:cytochrome c-type biogenesis protein CcmH/NrfG
MFGSFSALTVRLELLVMKGLLPALVSVFVFFSCGEEKKSHSGHPPVKENSYLNHSDSAKYVGIQTCRTCHQGIYETFIKTGMGRSMGVASRQRSRADFSSAYIFDQSADFHYQALWMHDSLFIKEFRLNKKDTLHLRAEQVNYIVGSGQHTNSHLQSVNGYVNQMPMTFYTQKKKWDLPPGFENGVNTRFSRKIGLECMTCHNAYPKFVLGSENKYSSVPQGIDCERCHGPGSIHVEQRQTQSPVDTSKYVDYSIVNPGKLPADRQFDICQRCHLQGNAVLKNGHSFYDFKPGMVLSDYISVFLPRYSNSDDRFIMASHADRLKQSKCFIASQSKTGNDPLRPSRGGMTCVTCHNPHVSVKETNVNVFNDACNKCHASNSQSAISLASVHDNIKGDKKNCVSCHMPMSGSSDIPHVTVHDHYIRKPVNKKEMQKIRQFLGLYCVNEKQPDAQTRVQAYLNQYEKFEQNAVYLDSAQLLLDRMKNTSLKFHQVIQLLFARSDYNEIVNQVSEFGYAKVLNSLSVMSYENTQAWTAYRISEAYAASGKTTNARDFIARACELAPYNLEFRNKLGTTMAALDKPLEAEKHFSFILEQNPKFVSAYSNLGYIKMLQGFPAEAYRLYLNGLKLDPDNESLLLNLAGYYLYTSDPAKARICIQKVLKKNPGNQKAKMILGQIPV